MPLKRIANDRPTNNRKFIYLKHNSFLIGYNNMSLSSTNSYFNQSGISN